MPLRECRLTLGTNLADLVGQGIRSSEAALRLTGSDWNLRTQASATNRPMQPLIQAWLESQCGQISGVARGVVMLLPRGGGSALAPAAAWPSGGPSARNCESAAKAAYDKQQPLTQGRLNGAERPIPVGPVISYPIQVKGKTVGAWAVLLNSDVTLPPHAAVSSVQRGAESFEEFMRHNLVPGKPASTSHPLRRALPPRLRLRRHSSRKRLLRHRAAVRPRRRL